jgi:ABC-type nitrate/sulfonate/bicarbonate transport system permease component
MPETLTAATHAGVTRLVFPGIITIALLGLILDACLRGLLLLADPSRRR